MATPESIVPRFGPRSEALRAPNIGILPPQIKTAAGIISPDRFTRALCVLQNNKDTVLLVAINNTPTANAYHWALKACSADDDGTGGSIDLSGIRGNIHIAAASGDPRCAIIEGHVPNMTSNA